jgi:hypothetical protein
MEYLPFEVTERHDAVEQYVIKPMLNCKINSVMSEIQSQYLVIGLLEDKQTEVNNELEDFYKRMRSHSLGLMILEQRLSEFGITITKSASLFLATTISTPGRAVMYATFIAYKCFEKSINQVTCFHLSVDIFPDGFFTEKELEDIWRGQKLKLPSTGAFSDNLLDYKTAFNSIRKKDN